MSNGFVKIYGSKLISSSLWDEAPEARLVFLGMLALADQHGVVDVPNERALARVLNLPQDWIDKALAVLTAPDAGSRTDTEDGRRVVRVGNAWKCVNYEAYREFRSAKQEADRKRIAAQRAKAQEAADRKEAIRNGRAKPTLLGGDKKLDAVYNLELMRQDAELQKAKGKP